MNEQWRREGDKRVMGGRKPLRQRTIGSVGRVLMRRRGWKEGENVRNIEEDLKDRQFIKYA